MTDCSPDCSPVCSPVSLPDRARRRGFRADPAAALGAAGLPVLLVAAMGLAACQSSLLPSGGGGNPGAGGSDQTTGPGQGGSPGPGGATGTGGRVGAGTGGAGMAGRTGAGGRVAGLGGAGGSDVVVPPSCGSTPQNLNPFGCNMAWGMNNPG